MKTQSDFKEQKKVFAELLNEVEMYVDAIKPDYMAERTMEVRLYDAVLSRLHVRVRLGKSGEYGKTYIEKYIIVIEKRGEKDYHWDVRLTNAYTMYRDSNGYECPIDNDSEIIND